MYQTARLHMPGDNNLHATLCCLDGQEHNAAQLDLPQYIMRV
jgi:hypothetical protein